MMKQVNKRYVNNLYDMLKHVQHHRHRVFQLGMEVTGPKQLKKIVFGLHDLEKFVFLPWLWKYYGAKGAGNQNARKLYTRMNKLGYFIVRTVLFFTPYTKEEINRMKRFERIVDVIDRHCDPVAMEEFNLTIKRPLVNFIRREDLPCAITFKQKWLRHFGSNV